MRVQLHVAAVIGALATIAVPAAAGSTGVMGPVLPDARMLVLQVSDLPGGFDLDRSSYVSNAELTKQGDAAKDYRKLGRVTGFSASFKRPGSVGVLGVDAFASIYRSSAGAHQSLALSLDGAARNGGPTFRWLDVGERLGSEARVYLVSSVQSGTKVDFYTVAWRHGRIFSEVMGGGVSGSIALRQVVALAEKQEARILTVLH